MYGRDELIQDVNIIITSIPDAYMFLVRGAFTLFMDSRHSGMAVNHITNLLINTISLFNWFEYLGFLFVVMPYYAETAKQ